MNGYERMHRLDIEARADMIETAAGFQNEARSRAELAFAISEADADDADSLRWLACVIDRRLMDMEAAVCS